jgi:hypothetical protein
VIENQWTPGHGRGQLFEVNGDEVKDIKAAQQKTNAKPCSIQGADAR